MPTYEYTCTGCGHEWEAFQSIKADPLTECPKCGAPKAKRQVSLGSGFILKGGGWYSDLYASQPKGSSRETPTSASSTGSTSDSSSSTSSSSNGKESSKSSTGSASQSKSSSAPASTAA